MLVSCNVLRLPQNPKPCPIGSSVLIRFPPCSEPCLLSSMSSSKIVAEYAKSDRSSCKKCSKSILANSLRLGLVSRDPRGFDATKWHHLECFPRKTQPITSVEKIKGFDALKNFDQEALRKLEGGGGDDFSKELPAVDEAGVDEAGVDDGLGNDSNDVKVHKMDESERDEDGDRDIKKPKLSASDNGAEPEIHFSISEIKNKYKDAILLPNWKAFQTVIFLERDDGLHDSEKIAAFDFDGCLANTSVKRIGADAWSLMYPSIPEKLQRLYSDGYKLVIFTNESNIERWKNKRQQAVDSKIGRLNNFIKSVKVPVQVFIACGLGKTKGQEDDPFRKPKPGMWRIMEQHFNSDIAINMDQSFYVGDAAGRANDHSDADIKFAKAVGLKFYLPEEYFGA